jgi:hypothetical protein
MALLQTLNNTRENILNTYYNAALAELEEKVRENPFQTFFDIKSGCKSEEITNDICGRFLSSGLLCSARWATFGRYWYLCVAAPLPTKEAKPEVINNPMTNNTSPNSMVEDTKEKKDEEESIGNDVDDVEYVTGGW